MTIVDLTRREAMAEIIDYIEPFNNQKQRQDTLRNILPADYEMKSRKST
ncbi:TPA: IS3 family transposase [Vibrio diabolicus]